MILLITGPSHTGKTLLAQRLLEAYHYPYLSIDHLKMGLIRSGNTALTPEDDEALTVYLWPIIREMIKTAIENHQNLVVEGCYIPLDWERSFPPSYLSQIRCICLAMSPGYIKAHFSEIKGYADAIEQRLDDTDCTFEQVLQDNEAFLNGCREYGISPVLIRESYSGVMDEIVREVSQTRIIGDDEIEKSLSDWR